MHVTDNPRALQTAFSRVRGGEHGYAGRATALFLCTYNAFAPLLPPPPAPPPSPGGKLLWGEADDGAAQAKPKPKTLESDPNL